MKPKLIVDLFGAVINYSALIWLSFIILYSIVVKCPIKLRMVYKGKGIFIFITQNKIILRKCFIFDSIHYFLRTILSVSLPLLSVLVVISDLVNIFETIGRRNQRDKFLVGSSNIITNYSDDRAFILLNTPHILRLENESNSGSVALFIYGTIVIIYPVKLIMFCTLAKGLLICLIHYTLRAILSTLNQPSFFMFIALQNTATKLKSRIYLTHYQTRILLNIICTFISLYIGSILFRINANKLCAENTIAAFLYLGNDETHLASFIAIGFLLFVRYFILRAILLTSIQLLFVFVANSGLVNVYEIIARTIQREILLVNSSNNNTNCGHDTVFGLLNPSPQKLNYVFAFIIQIRSERDTYFCNYSLNKSFSYYIFTVLIKINGTCSFIFI